MSSSLRMTYPTAMVLMALRGGCRYGFDIAAATGLRRGTVYPILRRLEDAGMVESEWEDADVPRNEGRPARKYYYLTPEADDLLREALQKYPVAGYVIPIPATDR